MKRLKDIKDINFVPEESIGTAWYEQDREVSEPIVMKSAAGWYIGSICRQPTFPDGDYHYEPYDRYTVYYANSYEPEQLLRKSQDTNPNHRQEIERCSVLF